MWPSTLEISLLLPAHRGALGLHLLALAPYDRHARFGVTMRDEAVLAWVAQLAWHRQRWWGAWLGDLGLLGALQLTPTRQAGTWELAMTVSAPVRGQHLGTRLMSAAIGQMPEVKQLVCHHGHAAVHLMARRLGYGISVRGEQLRLRVRDDCVDVA